MSSLGHHDPGGTETAARIRRLIARANTILDRHVHDHDVVTTQLAPALRRVAADPTTPPAVRAEIERLVLTPLPLPLHGGVYRVVSGVHAAACAG